MEATIERRKVSDVVFRDDLYPRLKPKPELVQRYAGILEVLPPVEVNQHNELIDGWHRWTAHRKNECDEITVTVTPTKSDLELFALAIQRNAAHGDQLDEDSKKHDAIRLYAAGTGYDKQEIADLLSVSVRSVHRYLSDVDKQLAEQRDRDIALMWLACDTQEEIADTTGVSQKTVANRIETFSKNGQLSKITKSLPFDRDGDFKPPLYTVWTFNKKSNAVSHFGNSEQGIVDNLLYLYTEPYDIVVDPFAGGGSTIDVCRKRLRRYWVSDRKPIVERESEIRQHDVVTDGAPPLNRNWSDVSLTYLDPPYWKQAEGRYSDDPTDLANMSRDDFTAALAGLVKEIGGKQSKGAIALLIQPTQWNAPGREVADHIIDLVTAVGNRRLKLAYRISCPYSTEQYNAQQVTWAKENRKLLVISRELIVWEVAA